VLGKTWLTEIANLEPTLAHDIPSLFLTQQFCPNTNTHFVVGAVKKNTHPPWCKNSGWSD
jgi:hypothetical protein